MVITTKSRGKRKKAKGLSRSERAEICRRNSLKSTGPRSACGKSRSRFNALKHGMTARQPLLPDEDAAALAAEVEALGDELQPRNKLEAILVEGIAGDVWRSEQSERAADGRAAFRIRHWGPKKARRERHQALELGERLFWQLAFPLPSSARYEMGFLTEPPSSKTGIHPHSPGRLVLDLEQTVAGCNWLIEHWNELGERLNTQKLWLSADALKMVRLMGRLATDVADNLDVARVFLSSFTLNQVRPLAVAAETFDWAVAVIKFLAEFDIEKDNGNAIKAAVQCEPFMRRLEQLPLAAMAPPGEVEAREWLAQRIEQERKRVEHIREEVAERAEADAAQASARLKYETGAEGDRHRRYLQSNGRLVSRRIREFLTVRKAVNNGTLDRLELESDDPALQAVLGELKGQSGHPTADQGPDVRVPTVASESRPGTADGLEERSQNDAPEADFGRRISDASIAGEAVCGASTFLRNEADELVRGPLSVVSGEDVAIAPNAAQATGGCSPSSGPEGHLLPRGEGEAPDEFALGAEGDGAEDGSAVRRGWDDPVLAADVDWDETNEWVRQGRERVRQRRAEELRQLNEQARKEREFLKEARRARHAVRQNGKPAAGAQPNEDDTATTVEEELRRMTTEALRSAIATVPAVDRPAAAGEQQLFPHNGEQTRKDIGELATVVVGPDLADRPSTRVEVAAAVGTSVTDPGSGAVTWPAPGGFATVCYDRNRFGLLGDAHATLGPASGMTSMIRLSAFADEISQNPVEQVDVLAAQGIKHIEFRAIHGTNVLDLSDAQHAEFRDLLRSRGFGLSAIGSPIGKIRINESFDEHLQRFDRAMELADYYEAPRIRIFSFYMPPGDDPFAHRAEVMSRMSELAGRAAARGISLFLENEKGIYGDTAARVADVIETVGSPSLSHAFDPANYVEVGQPIEEAWSRLRSHVTHFHVKDYDAKAHRNVPAGAGAGQIPRLLGEAVSSGYDGFCVLEPHLVVAELSFGFTGPERFADAANALKQILDDRSIEYS